MEKMKNWIVMFLVCLICICSAAPAFAESYAVYNDVSVEEIELQAAPADAIATASDDGAAASPYTISYSVYDDGMISSTYLEYARGLVVRCGLYEDYVFARTGQYEYIFAHGDWENDFSGEACIHQFTVSNYNTGYSYDVFTDSNFSLSVGDGLVYSSLPDYPSLHSPVVSNDVSILLVCAVGVLFMTWLAKMAFHSLGGWR